MQKNLTPLHAIDTEGKVFNIETGRVLSHRLNSANGYMYFDLTYQQKKKTYSLHRALAKCFLEDFKDHLVVDHINGDKTDNRLGNLRMVTQRDNVRHWHGDFEMSNIYKTKSGRYRVRMTIGGLTQHIGVFNTIEEAKEARDDRTK